MSFWLPCSFKWTKVCPLYQILFLLNQRECCYFILKYGKKSDPRVLFIVKNCTMDKLHGKKILISSALHFTVFTYNFIPCSTEMYCIFYLNVKTCCKNVPSRLSHKYLCDITDMYIHDDLILTFLSFDRRLVMTLSTSKYRPLSTVHVLLWRLWFRA